MSTTNSKNHWEIVYQTKEPDQVSWTQEIPVTSLDFIASLEVAKDAKIIDVGAGDSRLVDCLLELGYEDITVLDISEHALEKAKRRLGEKAKQVKWIVSDITEFIPDITYTVWHDRAAFHFLTTQEQVSEYLDIVRASVDGFLILGTFSDKGPLKCSGLEIKQYSENAMTALLENDFEKINCTTQDHQTPFSTLQNFLFCSFRRKKE